jgi:NADH dehydrogenase
MKMIIVGGGFAGLKLARSLNNHEEFSITFIDRFNYHQFQPLFYQVATAALDPSNISFPLRKAFHKSKNVRIRIAELKSISVQERKISTDIGEMEYDVLILASGADTNFFGNEHLVKLAFPMKSTVDAVQLRHRLIQNYEDALIAKSPEELESLMNIVVVGGGPTGVEVSGALAEMKRFVLPADYPELDFTKMKIYLLEGSPRTLGVMSEASSKQSRAYLEKLGVTVKTETIVKDYDGKHVFLNSGEKISAATVIWAAGIRGNVPAGIDPSLVVKGNRIKVDRYSQVQGIPGVYAIGDVAYMETPLYPHGHPQLANVAISQGSNLAKNFMRELKGKTKEPYEYHDKGSLATVGRHLAVADLTAPRIHLAGSIAWFVWMSLHLFLILGVKNKLQVFINWIYKYFTYDQSLRLLFKVFNRPRT